MDTSPTRHRRGDEPDRLRAVLGRVRVRLTLGRCWERVALLALWALACATAYAVATKFVKGLPAPDRVGVVLVGLALLVGLVWSLTRRPSILEAAVVTDEVLGLRERLSSALLLREQADEDPMVAALVTDARLRAEQVDPRQVCPFRWPRRTRGAAVAGACFLAALLVPNLGWFLKPADRAVQAEQKRQATKLNQIAKRVERLESRETAADRKRLAERLRKLSRELKHGRLTKGESLSEYRKLTAAAKRLHEQLAKANTPLPTQLRESLQNLTEKVDLSAATLPLPEAVREALATLAKKLKAGELSDAEQKQLTKALRQAAEALRKAGKGQAAKALEAAARQLQAGNASAAAAALAEANAALAEALSSLDAEGLADEMLAELLDGRLDLALADGNCPTCGQPQALCTCDKCGYG